MAVFNGNDFVIKSATTSSGDKEIFAHAQNVSLSFSNSLIDVTTKDSSSWAEMIAGQKSFSISASGLTDYAAVTDAQNFTDLTAIALAGTKIYFTIGLDSGGAGNTHEGEGFIESFEVSGGTDDAPTYSISVTGTGALTETA